MKPFDNEIEVIYQWRATFYNAEDVAENGDFAKYDTTDWQYFGNTTEEQKIDRANKYAIEHGFDTFEIEVRKEEIITRRYNTEG